VIILKKNIQWKNLIVGKIDKKHPQSEEINKAVDDTFKEVNKMIKDITSFTDSKPN